VQPAQIVVVVCLACLWGVPQTLLAHGLELNALRVLRQLNRQLEVCDVTSSAMNAALDSAADSASTVCDVSPCFVDFKDYSFFDTFANSCKEEGGPLHLFDAVMSCSNGLTVTIRNMFICSVSEDVNPLCDPGQFEEELEEALDQDICTTTVTHTSTQDFSGNGSAAPVGLGRTTAGVLIAVVMSSLAFFGL
jgi:hypothetical protein